jgi:hypothetical protein
LPLTQFSSCHQPEKTREQEREVREKKKWIKNKSKKEKKIIKYGKKKYLIDIGKIRGIYCEMYFYRKAKSGFVP